LVYTIIMYIPTSVFSQNTIPNFEFYTLQHEIIVETYDFLNEENLKVRKILKQNTVFEILDTPEIDGLAYTVLKPVKILEKNKKNKNSISSNNSENLPGVELDFYYVALSSKLKNNLEGYTPRMWNYQVGVSVIPIKIYLPEKNQPLDFTSSSVSQGATFGIAHQVSQSKSNVWINYMFSMNFTKVTPREDDFVNTNFDGNDLAALSPAFGVGINFKAAALGFHIGKDYLPGTAASSWKHNGTTWYSISIGTSFNVNPTDSSKQ